MPPSATNTMATENEAIVKVKNLTFRYDSKQHYILNDINLEFRRGQRIALVGGNGAGKTTLLRVLGGKHMIPSDAVRILDKPAFHDTTLNYQVAYLGDSMWKRDVPLIGYGVPYGGDFPARDLWLSMSEYRNNKICQDRCAELVALLDIDPEWRMHKVSDGQRRRVEILLKLMQPYDVLLLDEVTVDLDVVARADFLSFLRSESERGAVIIYATHIFDGLEEWASDILFLSNNTVKLFQPLEEIEDYQRLIEARKGAPLLRTVEQWLRNAKVEYREMVKKQLSTPAPVAEDTGASKGGFKLRAEAMQPYY